MTWPAHKTSNGRPKLPPSISEAARVTDADLLRALRQQRWRYSWLVSGNDPPRF